MPSGNSGIIRAIFFADEESGKWIGQGLEVDICAQGASLEDAQSAFEAALTADAMANVQQGRHPFEGIDEAPAFFWQMYEAASKTPPLRADKPISLKNAATVLLSERLGPLPAH